MNVSELPLRLGRVAGALQERAATAAANAMAQTFHRTLVTVTLRTYTHPAGTVTTSPAGGPPALVSGTLRRSARIIPAAAVGPKATAEVRVGAVYARIQERGGTIKAKRAPFLKFQYPAGQWHSVKSVTLPKRPYMAPTLTLVVSSGLLRAAAKDAVRAVATGAEG